MIPATTRLHTAAAVAYVTGEYVEVDAGLTVEEAAQQAHEFLAACGLSASVTARVNKRSRQLEIRARRDAGPEEPAPKEKPQPAEAAVDEED